MKKALRYLLDYIGLGQRRRKESVMNKNLPYVNAFLICERVLTEQDGVNSLVRVIDTIGIDSLTTKENRAVLPLTMFVALKSGDYKGVCKVTFVWVRPSGTKSKPSTVTAELEGGNRGVNMNVNAVLPVPEEGLYWGELYINDEFVTKTPLSVLLAPSSTSAQPLKAEPERSPSSKERE